MNVAQVEVALGGLKPDNEAQSRLPLQRDTRYLVDDLEGCVGAFDPVTVINLSLSGVAIETHKYLQIGKSYPLRLNRQAEDVRVSAIVVWSRLIRTVRVKGGVEPIYRAGLRFSNLSVADKRDLESFVVDEIIGEAAGRGEPPSAVVPELRGSASSGSR